MTAEVVILNKSAVVLAADSAVTISAGSSQEKIYDSADKLFELSLHDPIGVMINGDMNFMQAPIGVLIKKYRSKCRHFPTVSAAAEDFLLFLARFGAEAPEAVKVTAIQQAVMPPLKTIKNRANDQFFKTLMSADNKLDNEDVASRAVRLRSETLSEQMSVMKSALRKLPDAKFVGNSSRVANQRDSQAVNRIIKEYFDDLDTKQLSLVREVCKLALRKTGVGPSSMGVIVAGYGKDELFPTMAPYEVYGIVGDKLKYAANEVVDVDREGTRAKVIPFAQREMVERFLYGLDDRIVRNITNFCKGSVPKIRSKILDNLDMSDEDAAEISHAAEAAEKAFFEGLNKDSFDAIRAESKTAIEDMVEFMPKPEMARMAEALVNLTSIKRRVSRGMETVGGPIDVAVISQAEGFVWVKRKHYFPRELNARYFDRKQGELGHRGEASHG